MFTSKVTQNVLKLIKEGRRKLEILSRHERHCAHRNQQVQYYFLLVWKYMLFYFLNQPLDYRQTHFQNK